MFSTMAVTVLIVNPGVVGRFYAASRSAGRVMLSAVAAGGLEAERFCILIPRQPFTITPGDASHLVYFLQ